MPRARWVLQTSGRNTILPTKVNTLEFGFNIGIMGLMPPPAPAPALPEVRAAAARPWRRLVLPGLLLVLAGFLVYAPALHGEWMRDDAPLIRDNPLMAEANGWWKFWFAPPGPDYFPLTSTFEWAVWRIFGNHTLPFHLAGLALHVVSAFVLWRILARLGLRLAWLGALLFVIHPLAVESVAWISELKNTVSLPLLLFSLWFWLNYDERRRPADYLAALLFFLAALLAKTSVVMLPFLLLLHVWWKRGQITRENLKAIAPFFLVAGILGVLTVFFQNQWAIGEEPIEALSLPQRAAGAGWALLFYTWKFFWPAHLLPFYPQWSFDPLRAVDFLPWLVIALALGILWWQRATGWGRTALLGLGFFAVNLAPVLGFLAMSYMRISWVADHFVYLPMVGLIGLVVAGLDRLLAALPRFFLPGAAGLMVLAIFSLGWESNADAGHFLSHQALWTYTLAQTPNSWRAELTLATALDTDHRTDEAIEHLKRALELDGSNYTTHLVLGNVYTGQNRFAEAREQYHIASLLRPDALDVRINYGYVLLRLGDVTGSETQCALAVWFHPDSATAHYNYGNVLLREGRGPDAATQYQLALDLQPDFTAASDVLKKLRARIAPAAK